MKHVLMVSVLFTVAAAGAADAGRAKPKWCTDSARMLSTNLDSFQKDGDVEDGLEAVVGAYCNPDSQRDNEWGPFDDAYHKLSTRLGLTDADWPDVADWASEKRAGWRDIEMNPPEKKPWSQLSPMEQFTSLKHSDSSGELDIAYQADALGDHLTETGRLEWISWCIAQANDSKAVAWAMCQPDIDAFDPKKVFAELRGETAQRGADRMWLRIRLDSLKDRLASHASEVKKLLASDPIYGQMFDIAKKQRAEWKASPDIVALQAAMEDASISESRKASEGCADKTLKALLPTISKIPAKTFQLHRKAEVARMLFIRDMYDVIAVGLLSQPDSFLALNAYAMCRDTTNTSNDDTVMGTVYAVGERWSGLRGPRTAAMTRIFQENLQPDDRSAKITYPAVKRGWFATRDGAGSGGVSGDGTVTKVSPKGGKTHIDFQKHKHQEYVSLGCKPTNHIQAIRDNGEIVYDQICSDSKLLTTMDGPDPIDLSADAAKAVKVGMVLDVTNGIVIVGWQSEKSDMPAIVLGQPVK